MVPSFINFDEQKCPQGDPLIARMRQRFSRLTLGSVSRIISSTETISDEWGCILRVVYRGKLDGYEVLNDQIFVAWQKPGEIMGVCMSPLEEDDFWVQTGS